MDASLEEGALPQGGRPIRSAVDVVRFAFAGRATLTVVSKRSDARYTVRVTAPKDETDGVLRFVSVLAGEDYRYLGLIPDIRRPALRLTGKSHYGRDAAPVRAVAFLCERVLAHPEAPLPADLEVWHEGRCGKCGRPLTVPESIERGIGPECWARLGGA